jgi:ATP-dependent Clp protease ATP-binding subunit ClpX
MYGGRFNSSAPNSASGAGGSASPGRGETYSIRTDNILFIFTGAFIGLNKLVMNRISRGSIGFGSPIKSTSVPDGQNPDMTLSVKPGSKESELFEKHLPFFAPAAPGEIMQYNPLDLIEPTDLQSFGMIPELVGRIPVTAALSALDEDALVRVLTEPRNSLIRQYEQLFQLSGVELRFTTGALREVARGALGMGTGARGLRTGVERVLGEAMFEAPGSSIKHILITEAVAQRKKAPIYLARGQQHKFHALLQAEEEEYAKWMRKGKEGQGMEAGGGTASFEEYREKVKAAALG